MFVIVLQDSWSFFKNHFIVISLIVLPLVVPIEIFSSIYQYFFITEESSYLEEIFPTVVGLLAYPIYSVAVVFYLASVIASENINIKTLWQLGIKYWLPYFILTLLISIVVALGFLALILPGLLFLTRYAFSEFELLLNQCTPLTAMKKSWSMTKDYMWILLGGYILITIILYTPAYLISALLNQASIAYWVLDTILNMFYSVLYVIYTIFTFRVYELVRANQNE